MIIIEVICFCLIILLCFSSSKSDFISGNIYNKHLFPIFLIAIIFNILYYGFYANDLFIEYLINIIIVSGVILYLFYSYSFAGGDCKLVIIISMLYPARYYMIYNGYSSTLIFSICISILLGYIYLLFTSIKKVLFNESEINFKYLKNTFRDFLKAYIIATFYIYVTSFCLMFLNKLGVAIFGTMQNILCMLVAWFVGKYKIFKTRLSVTLVVLLSIILSIVFNTVPFSLNTQNYIFVFGLLLCQMAIRTVIYESVSVDRLKKGMILSTMSSIPMQYSVTKGLPYVSTEDLKSRLTEQEVDSIKKWAKATHTESLVMVKKIPFAIFISAGFILYFLLRSLLWV